MATSPFDRIKSHKRPVSCIDLEESSNKKIKLNKQRVSLYGNISKQQIRDVKVLLEDVLSGVHTIICDPSCVTKHHPLVLSLGVQRDSKMRECLDNYLKLAAKNGWKTRIRNDGSCLFAQYSLTYLSVLFGKPQQLEFLINSGIDCVDSTSCCLLHTAVNHVNDFRQCASLGEKAQVFWQMVEILVKHNSSVLYMKDDVNGDSILHLCSRKIRELSLQIKNCGSGDHWDTNCDHLLNQRALFERCFKIIVEKFDTLRSEGVLCESETAVLFDSKNNDGETVLQILEDAESVQEIKNYNLVESSLGANVKDIKHLKETSGFAQQQNSAAVMGPKISSIGKQESLNCKVVEESSCLGMQQAEKTLDGNFSNTLSVLEHPLNKKESSHFLAEQTECETPEERGVDCDYLRDLLNDKNQPGEKNGSEHLVVESSQNKGHETSTSLDKSHELKQTKCSACDQLQELLEADMQQKEEMTCSSVVESVVSEMQEMTGEHSEPSEKLLQYEREETRIMDCELLEPPMETGLQQSEKESCLSTDESSETERREINENSEHAEKLLVYQTEDTGLSNGELLETPIKTGLQQKEKESCISMSSMGKSSELEKQEDGKMNPEHLSELSEECQGEQILRSLGYDLSDQTTETKMRQQAMVKNSALINCESLEELTESYEVEQQGDSESSTVQHVYVKGQKGCMDCQSFNVALQADRQQKDVADSRFVDDSSENKKGCQWRVGSECCNDSLESEKLDHQVTRKGTFELPSKLAPCEIDHAKNETSALQIGKGDNEPVLDSLDDAMQEVGGTVPETSAKSTCSGKQGMQQEGLKHSGNIESYQLQKTENSKSNQLLEVPEWAKHQNQSIQGNVTSEKSKRDILEERDERLHKSLECNMEESRIYSNEDTVTYFAEDNNISLTTCSSSPNQSSSRGSKENSKGACESEKSVIAADLEQWCTVDTSVKHFDLGEKADKPTSNVVIGQMSVVCPQTKDVEVPEGVHSSLCTADCSATHHILVQLLCATPDHHSVERLEAENKACSEFRGYLKKTAWDFACDVPDPCPELQYPIAHLACRLGKYRALEELSEFGFDPLCRCCTGETPLHSLVRLVASESAGYLFLPRVVVNIFKTLSKRSTALSLISAKDGDGCTVLHTLAYIVLITNSDSVVFLYAFVFRLLVSFLLSEHSGARGVDHTLQLLKTCNNAGHNVRQLLEASVLGRQLLNTVTNLLDAFKKKSIQRLESVRSKEAAVMSDSSGRLDTGVSSNQQTPGSGNAVESTPCGGVFKQMEDDVYEGNSCTSSRTTNGIAEPSKYHSCLEDQLEGNKCQSMMLDNSTTEVANNKQGSSIMEEQLQENECRNRVSDGSASEAANAGKTGFTRHHQCVKERLKGMEDHSEPLDASTPEATKNKADSSGHYLCMEDQFERMEGHCNSLDVSTSQEASNKKVFAERHPSLEDKLEVADRATGIFDDSTSEAGDPKPGRSKHHSHMEERLQGMECRNDSTFEAPNNKAEASRRHPYVQDQLDETRYVSGISNDSTPNSANAKIGSPGRNPCMEDQLEESGSQHGTSNCSLLEATSEEERPSVLHSHHSCVEEALDAREFSNENSSNMEGSSTFNDRRTDDNEGKNASGRGLQVDSLSLNGEPETLIEFILSSDWKIAAGTKEMIFRRFDEECVDRIRCIQRKMNSTKKEFMAIYNLEMKRNKSETLKTEIKRISSKIEEKKGQMAKALAQKNKLMEQETASSESIELIDQVIVALQESATMMNRSEEVDRVA